MSAEIIPLVFVHGFMGGGDQWPEQVDGLAALNPVMLDLPGFGKNAALETQDSIAGYGAWALEELRRRGIERFHLLGHSMGGMVAQEMITQAPDRVMRLVLYGTGATGVLPGRFETIDTSKQRAKDDGAQATARRIAATWFLKREADAAYEGCAKIAEKSSLATILTGLDAMHNWSGTANLRNITAETLVIWGDQDRTYPWQQIEQLWRDIEYANLAVVPNASHAIHLEKPALFNDLITDFFAS